VWWASVVPPPADVCISHARRLSTQKCQLLLWRGRVASRAAECPRYTRFVWRTCHREGGLEWPCCPSSACRRCSSKPSEPTLSTKVVSGVRTRFGRIGMPNFCAGGSPIPRVSRGGGPRLDEQEAGRSLPFAIVSLADGVIVGSTRYGNIDRPNRHVEIGWTWVAPRWQRTAINTEAKLLPGCIRVEFKTDRLNEQSRTALKRIGAVEEGEHPRRGVARHPGDTGGGFESACRSGPAPVARRPCESRNVTNDQTVKCQGCRTLAPIKSKPRKGIRLALAGSTPREVRQETGRPLEGVIDGRGKAQRC
jgi:hypothetical protein